MQKIGAILLGTLLLVLGGYLWSYQSTPEVYSLRLATGKLTKPLNRMTKYFEDRGPRYKIEFQLQNTDGSEDSLARLGDGTLDVALVKAGLKLPAGTPIRQLTALDVEVFHVLVKGELAGAANKDLGILRGKTININTPATGTHHWSLDLLRFAGLNPTGVGKSDGFRPTMFDNAWLLRAVSDLEQAAPAEQAALRSKLPDAIMLGSPLPSIIARRLISVGKYQLIPLTFAPAYILERRAETPEGDVLDHATVIENVDIPAYLYGFDPPVPPQACPSIGFRRLVVARDDVPLEAGLRILRMIYDTPQDGTLDPIDLDKLRPQYGLHPAVAAFKNERTRIFQTTLLNWGEKFISILSGVLGASLAIFGYLSYRRARRLGRFFDRIQMIDRAARGQQADLNVPLDPAAKLFYLEERLADVRNEVILEFTQAGYRGEGLINNLLCTIADTRASLPQLVAQDEKLNRSRAS